MTFKLRMLNAEGSMSWMRTIHPSPLFGWTTWINTRTWKIPFIYK